MSWHHTLSSTEREEFRIELCAALARGEMTAEEFRTQIGELGCNATEIEEMIKFYQPEPPEEGELEL